MYWDSRFYLKRPLVCKAVAPPKLCLACCSYRSGVVAAWVANTLEVFTVSLVLSSGLNRFFWAKSESMSIPTSSILPTRRRRLERILRASSSSCSLPSNVSKSNSQSYMDYCDPNPNVFLSIVPSWPVRSWLSFSNYWFIDDVRLAAPKSNKKVRWVFNLHLKRGHHYLPGYSGS